MKLGLIGPGRHGSRYLQEQNGGRYFTRVLSRKPRLDLPDWVKGTTDPEEFFAPGLDGVVIATPTETHCAIAMVALRRGLDVLCEKPLTPSWPQALLLLNTAAALGRRLVVAHTDLFHSAFRFGNPDTEPKHTVIEVGDPVTDPAEWAPHAIAMALAINGTDHIKSWTADCTPERWIWAIELAGKSCSICIRKGPKIRRADVAFYSGQYASYDGCSPSEPTPLGAMVKVFASGRTDWCMTQNFTRTVYRVLLTES